MSSLNALRRKINPEVLGGLQPLLLLQMLVGVSQAVSGSVSRSRALARTLLLNGQQRLHDLAAAAPRLHLPVEQLLELCHPSDAEPTPEETAAQALVELCLGLMLQWLAEDSRQPDWTPMASKKQRTSRAYRFPSFPQSRPPTARGWPTLPLA